MESESVSESKAQLRVSITEGLEVTQRVKAKA